MSLCSPFKCRYTQLKDETYQTQHVFGCTGCHDIVADSAELCEILEKGSIPFILSIDDKDENETIAFVEAEPWMSYVAISHVWSDRLGNPYQNALPKCQLVRLSDMVRRLDGQYSNIILFWIDTICIPPDSSGMKQAQDLAIPLMRKTYEEATSVLVLDSWLFTTTSIEKSYAEISPDYSPLAGQVDSGLTKKGPWQSHCSYNSLMLPMI